MKYNGRDPTNTAHGFCMTISSNMLETFIQKDSTTVQANNYKSTGVVLVIVFLRDSGATINYKILQMSCFKSKSTALEWLKATAYSFQVVVTIYKCLLLWGDFEILHAAL